MATRGTLTAGAIVLTIWAGLAVSAQAGEVLYEVIDLGTTPDRPLGGVHDISNSCQIVGYTMRWSPPYDQQAVLYDPTGNGNNVILGTPGEGASIAFAINQSGLIVGTETLLPQNRQRAMRFDPSGSGVNVDLHPQDITRVTHAYDVNNSGVAVGALGDGPPMIWDTTGGGNNTYLPMLFNATQGAACAINNHGTIVGWSENADRSHRPVVFDTENNQAIELAGDDVFSGCACDVNGTDQAVGYVSYGVGRAEAMLFDTSGNGNHVALGGLGGVYAEALGINYFGQIVGNAYDANNSRRAMLFDPTGNGDNIDLNNVIDPVAGWYLSDATAINDLGWIVGKGGRAGEYQHAVLLRPIPEPTSAVLLFAGALLLLRRRS